MSDEWAREGAVSMTDDYDVLLRFSCGVVEMVDGEVASLLWLAFDLGDGVQRPIIMSKGMARSMGEYLLLHSIDGS